MIEVLEYRNQLHPDLQNSDCIEWLFGHKKAREALRRVRSGSGYDLIHETQLEEGDIVIFGDGANDRHCAVVQDGQVVGKYNSSGDVLAGTIDDYRQAYMRAVVYRRNAIPFNSLNDPFHIED